MALVPLYNQGRTPPVSADVSLAKIPEGLAGGIARNTSGIARAGQKQTVDPRPFMAPAIGAAAIGGAVAKVGEFGSQWAQKRIDIQDRATASELTSEWRGAMKEFEAKSETMPSEQMEDAWNDQLQKIKEKYSEARLSPDARNRFQPEFDRFVSESQINVRIAAGKKDIARARMAGENAIEESVYAGDMAGVRYHAQSLVDGGLATPEQADKVIRKAEQAALRLRAQSTIGSNPLELLMALKAGEYPSITGDERRRYGMSAQRAAMERRESVRATALKGILDGNISSPEDILNYDSNYLLGEDRDALHSFLTEEGENDPARFNALLRQASLYDKNDDPSSARRHEITIDAIGSGLEKDQVMKVLDALGVVTTSAETEADSVDADDTRVWTNHISYGTGLLKRLNEGRFAEAEESEHRNKPWFGRKDWNEEAAQHRHEEKLRIEREIANEQNNFLRWINEQRSSGRRLEAKDIDEWIRNRTSTSSTAVLSPDYGRSGSASSTRTRDSFDEFLQPDPDPDPNRLPTPLSPVPPPEGSEVEPESSRLFPTTSSVRSVDRMVPSNPDDIPVIGDFRLPPDVLESALPPALSHLADDFVRHGRAYDVNPFFLAAIAMLETGNGTSPDSRWMENNNPMGISNSNGPRALSSASRSIEMMAERIGRGNTYAATNSIAEVALLYAPPYADNDPHNTNKDWPLNIPRLMQQLKQNIPSDAE